MKVDRKTPEGGSIVAIVDYTSGSNADAPSVSEYVKRVFKKWMQNSAYVAQVRLASEKRHKLAYIFTINRRVRLAEAFANQLLLL